MNIQSNRRMKLVYWGFPCKQEYTHWEFSYFAKVLQCGCVVTAMASSVQFCLWWMLSNFEMQIFIRVPAAKMVFSNVLFGRFWGHVLAHLESVLLGHTTLKCILIGRDISSSIMEESVSKMMGLLLLWFFFILTY